MDRLSILLTLMTGAVLAGPILVAGFSLGYQTVWVTGAAAAVSIIFAWPVAYLISRRIKRNDPNWHREADPKVIPDANAPEV